MKVLVTGSSRGIGRAIAVHLARPGGTVVVNYLQNEGAAEETARLVREQGAVAVVVQGNVRAEDDLKRLAAALGPLDVLVHNAAIGALKPYDKLRTAHWDLTLESSLRPFWLLTKHARLADGASVIGISSLGSRSYIPGYAAMGAAKGGLEALTRQLAVELAPRGIRVNTVCGGLIDTDSLDHLPTGHQMKEAANQYTPLGRVGQPDDVARAVRMLVGPDAGFITGQVIVVDGGLSLL
ncbi:MAG: SDR family oxidoreductase [Alphaproteobacteria bacterium]|nr:SDR family oxidoreductase [Alphaproteobacteria bacterium]